MAEGQERQRTRRGAQGAGSSRPASASRQPSTQAARAQAYAQARAGRGRAARYSGAGQTAATTAQAGNQAQSSQRRGAHAAPAKKGSSPRRRVFAVILAVAIVILVLSLGALGVIAYSYWQGQSNYDAVAEQAFSSKAELEALDDASDSSVEALAGLSIDWDALLAKNPDTVGWVYIPGTAVNYPVVQPSADDPDRYLTYDFEGNAGGRWLPTYGTPYLLASNASDFSDRNNIIQGHHLLNGEMFAAIADMADSATFNAHRSVYLLTPKGNYRLNSIALVHCDGDDAIVQTGFASTDEFAAYVQDKLDRSIVEASPAAPAASEVSQLFMFSTCDSTGDARYVLVCEAAQYAAADGTGLGLADAAETSIETATKEIVS